MISILVLVVDIYPVMLPHRSFFVLVTSGQLYSMIALLLLEVVMHARFMHFEFRGQMTNMSWTQIL